MEISADCQYLRRFPAPPFAQLRILTGSKRSFISSLLSESRVMRKGELSDTTCSLGGALTQIGDAWILMIIKEIMLGNRRFDGIQEQTGMSSNSLSSRLKALEKAGIVKRKAYQSGPARYQYGVTEKGADIWPVLVAFTRWGDQWLTDGPPPLQFGHKGCCDNATPTFHCSCCNQPLDARSSEPHQSEEMVEDRQRRRSTR